MFQQQLKESLVYAAGISFIIILMATFTGWIFEQKSDQLGYYGKRLFWDRQETFTSSMESAICSLHSICKF